MFHHYEQAFGVSFISFSFIGSGIYFLGVECFFILSGYFEFIKDYHQNNHFFYCFIKKVIRIYPTVIISTTFAYVICFIFGSNGLNVIDQYFSFSNYISNVLLIFSNGIFGINILGVNNPLWYLSVLLVLYVYFYFIKYISNKYKININFMLCVNVVIFVFVEYFHLSIPFFCEVIARGIIPFCVGGLVASINKRIVNYRINVFSFIGFIAIVITYVIKAPFFIEYKRYIYISFISFINSFLSKFESNIKVFQHPFFNHLGKISFEMYVWHSPVFYVFMVIKGYYNVLPTGCMWFAFLVMLFVIIWSDLMYRFIEKPIYKKLLFHLNI